MIVIGWAAPATFYKLKWAWNMFYFIGMLEHQRTTLKEDGVMHLYQASTLVRHNVNAICHFSDILDLTQVC